MKSESEKNKKVASTWFNDKYENVLIQRNILAIFSFVCILLVMVSVLAVIYINSIKEIEPFVIEVNKKTGQNILLKQASESSLNQNESLAQFFLKQYISARETYNHVDFEGLAREKIRLFSSYDVYRQYLGYIRNMEISPVVKYSTSNSTYLIIKSWSKMSSSHYIVRFSINETTGAMAKFNRIAVIKFEYQQRQLTEKELEINPVGFTVTAYRVDSDES